MKMFQITALVILGIIIVLLSGFLIAGLLGYIDSDFFKYTSSSVLIFDEMYDGSEMKDIDTKLKSADVKLMKSEDQSIRIVYYGPKSELDNPSVNAEYVDGVLKIRQESRIRFFRFFSSERIEIYLPQKYLGSIEFALSSGNLEFMQDFEFSEINMQLSSGNIKAKTLKADNMFFSMLSGNMTCEGIYSEDYEIKMSSSTFKTDVLTGEGIFKSSSGKVSLKHYSGSGEIKLTSGNLYLGIDELWGDLDIGLSSGNAKVEMFGDTDGIYCDLRSTSGSIKTNFSDVDNGGIGSKLQYAFSETKEHKLSIKVGSGNVRIEKVN